MEQIDGFDTQRVGENEHAIKAGAVAAVLDPVDRFAVEPAGLGQALLRPVGLGTQGRDAVSELGTVGRQTRIHRRCGHGATLVRFAMQVRTNSGTQFPAWP